MTYKDLQIYLLEINLTIKELALLLGMHPNSITNYKSSGLIPMHLAITISLIIALKKKGIDPMEIINEVKRKHSLDFIDSKNAQS
jgi:plasmid maintenance system antidote protein VapI